MLDSTEAPFYSKPNSPLIPNNIMKIIAGKTIVPIDIGRYSPKDTASDYFIWRTKLDGKVRSEHLKNEGKLFLKEDYNNGILPTSTIIAVVLQKKLLKIYTSSLIHSFKNQILKTSVLRTQNLLIDSFVLAAEECYI